MKGESSTSRVFSAGARAALPIVLGYVPVGIAFGVLARQAGLSLWEATAMSLFVYAGASQFIAADMLAAGAAFIPIILTTFMVNLRHLLMSSAIACHLGRRPLKTAAAVSAELTDESFALLMCRPEYMAQRPAFIIGLQLTAQAAWVGGTAAGAAFGAFIDSSSYGIPFALPALFISLLIMQLKNRMHLAIAALAGAAALVFKALIPGNWYIILAAMLAAAAGFLITGKKQEA